MIRRIIETLLVEQLGPRFRGMPALTAHQKDLDFLMQAIARQERETEALRRRFRPGNCCPSCSVPGYSEAVDKLNRQLATLRWKIAKEHLATPTQIRQARRILADLGDG